jgi:hypothetical protein
MSVEDRIAVVQSNLEYKQQVWVEMAKSAASRMESWVGPSESDVQWLISFAGQLAVQSAEYSELRGRLNELRKIVGESRA